VASSVANDVIMIIAGLVADGTGLRYGDWRHVATGCNVLVQTLEMWANAQRDGRPVKYSWRPLFNAA